MKSHQLFSYILLLTLILSTVFLPACSENKPTKPKPEQIDNPKVKESFKSFVIPKIKSLDVEHLKRFGFGPLTNVNSEILKKRRLNNDIFDNGIKLAFPPNSSQTKCEMNVGYMRGEIWLWFGFNLKELDLWSPDFIKLSFVKLSKNEPWKLVTHNYNSYVQDYSYAGSEKTPVRVLPIGVHSYIKSKFETIDLMKFRSPDDVNSDLGEQFFC